MKVSFSIFREFETVTFKRAHINLGSPFAYNWHTSNLVFLIFTVIRIFNKFYIKYKNDKIANGAQPALILTTLTNAKQHYVKIPYTDFYPNGTIYMDIRIAMH